MPFVHGNVNLFIKVIGAMLKKLKGLVDYLALEIGEDIMVLDLQRF